MADAQIALREYIYIYSRLRLQWGCYGTDLKNTLRRQVEISRGRMITFIITGRVMGRRKRKTKNVDLTKMNHQIL
jgi:hypothetical protein